MTTSHDKHDFKFILHYEFKKNNNKPQSKHELVTIKIYIC